MPRTKVNCTSCHKPITNTRQMGAKVLDWSYFDWNKRKFVSHRIYLHPECYERDNQEARKNQTIFDKSSGFIGVT